MLISLTSKSSRVQIFESTEIEMGESRDGEVKCTINGRLTLHGKTKPISFTALCRFENGGFVLLSKFNLDRSRFGMDQMLSGVDKLVQLEIAVGKRTAVPESDEGHGGSNNEETNDGESVDNGRSISLKLPHMT